MTITQPESEALALAQLSAPVLVLIVRSDLLPGCWAYLLVDDDGEIRAHEHLNPRTLHALPTLAGAEGAARRHAADLGLEVFGMEVRR